MTLDPYSYVTPSRVKTLVCPYGTIKRNLFLQYYERLVNALSVRLVDVTPDGRSDRGR
jgi:Transport protein Trs120 or TRAPPC9, TRAPP II complex subunit